MSPISFSQLSYHPEFDSCKHHISDEGSTVSIQTNAKTDWWRTGQAWRSTGPLLGLVLEKGKPEWTAEVEMGGDWKDEVDQATLMLYQSKSSWIKTGVEYTENKAWFSAVVTSPFSDWSLLPAYPSPLPSDSYSSFQIQRLGARVKVSAKLEGEWVVIRDVTNFGLKDDEDVWIGVMGCSPLGSGTEVRFKNLDVKY
ncbi:uncharacterized protein STEHIDRAFT_123344 [Stereum hirsutum FP-91666 SS1]|uniref:uncharacterized protein n=1 Tax=Stereum hirsutum (strain FP-91666) TaxID=721885 RepID=UPI000444980C|nr:uncharacterized protein STEHIDRAFT_123344 [Stereum hirsutum FP-91666 SS1]EIM83721.1 hypothetical protein STEHIDRAFT_123344 [Stereum hirsutum FP-91666 SS1]